MGKYFDYYKLCNNLLKNLPGRTKQILESRFGLKGFPPKTLESIGKEHGITRERVRQIEQEGLGVIKGVVKKIAREPLRYFDSQFKVSGGLKKEEKIVSEWSDPKFRNHVLFLLTLGDQFKRIRETEDFYSFWTIEEEILTPARQVIDSFIRKLKEKNQLMSIEEYNPPSFIKLPPVISLTPQAITSYLEISKQIMVSPDGLYGFPHWPEVNPRGIKDKAYLVLKKENNPLHFTEVASLIENLPFSSKKILPQSVHNELIKDPRFVLIGRGLYALREWGYEPGVVKDIIVKILKKAKKPMSREEIIKKVLEQRRVKENTILLNLRDKKYFIRDSQGRYKLRKA